MELSLEKFHFFKTNKKKKSPPSYNNLISVISSVLLTVSFQ